MLNKLLTLALIVAMTNGIHLKAQPPKDKKNENTNTNTNTDTESNETTTFNVDGVGEYDVNSGMLGGGMLGSGSG